MSDTKHPMQPIELVDGIARFKENRLVRFLVDQYGLCRLADSSTGASEDDWNQLVQLIGYSVSGFGLMVFADPELVSKADKLADSCARTATK